MMTFPAGCENRKSGDDDKCRDCRDDKPAQLNRRKRRENLAARPKRPGRRHGLSSWRPIHSMRKSTMRDWRSGGMAVPFGTLHHLHRHPRQHVAVACCALNTGCPRMGVCLPSFGGMAGASRVRMKSSAWRRIVSMPLSAMYFLSASESRNRERNFDFASLWNAASAGVTGSLLSMVELLR